MSCNRQLINSFQPCSSNAAVNSRIIGTLCENELKDERNIDNTGHDFNTSLMFGENVNYSVN